MSACSCNTPQDVYRARAARVADPRDGWNARWCLRHELDAEAEANSSRAQGDPNSPDACRMLGRDPQARAAFGRPSRPCRATGGVRSGRVRGLLDAFLRLGRRVLAALGAPMARRKTCRRRRAASGARRAREPRRFSKWPCGRTGQRGTPISGQPQVRRPRQRPRQTRRAGLGLGRRTLRGRAATRGFELRWPLA